MAQRLLRRHGLAIRGQPILVLEHHRARRAGRLTKRTREAMWQLRHGRTRHVAAAQPAELVCLDTFYIAQLKMVGKVWQVTACDAAWRAGARQPRSSSVPAARLAELMHRSSGLNVSTPNQIWTG